VIYKAVPTQDVTSAVGLPPSYCIEDIPLSLTPCVILMHCSHDQYILIILKRALKH